MRYSLLNRFQGCVIGAELGKAYTSIRFQQVAGWSQAQLLGIKSLVGKGQFDLNDWNRLLSSEFIDSNSINDLSRGGLLGLSLPIALFYHENEIKLQKNLLSIAEIWPDDVELRDGLLVVGYTIAQSLQEKLSSRTLIAQVIAFMNSDGSTAQKLLQVKTLLEQGSGLETVNQLFSQDTQLSSAVALAIYYFLSTLEDFRLSILRAARTSIHPVTPTIVGALAGAYNSTVGIPASMRVVLSRTALETQKTDLAQMLELVNNLLATWSGMYDQTPANVLASVTAIAAPNVIR